MEDYIFIIIAIVLSALGALNRNKKKRIAQMEEGNTEKKESSYFEKQFFDPFFDEEEEPEPAPVYTQPVAPASAGMPKPTFGYQREPIVKAKKEVKEDAVIEEIEDETTLESIMNDFSLKKAVIYSEVLKRKY